MTVKLSKADQHSLDTFNGWKVWGESFGFLLHGTNDEWRARRRIMDSREQKAFDRGADAARRGKSSDSNPYTHETTIQSANHRAWLAGYRSIRPHS